VPEYKVYVIYLFASNEPVVKAISAIEATAQSTMIVKAVVVIGVVPKPFVSVSAKLQEPRCAFVMLASVILWPLAESVAFGVKVINGGKLLCTTPSFVATREVNVFTFVATQSTAAGSVYV
jgi:hypothetical protein